MYKSYQPYGEDVDAVLAEINENPSERIVSVTRIYSGGSVLIITEAPAPPRQAEITELDNGIFDR